MKHPVACPNCGTENTTLEMWGRVNPDTGYLIDMKDLKGIISRTVVADCDHRHLNIEVPWMAGINPTAENLARIFFQRVEPALPEGVELASLTVHETERNSATYSNS